MPRKAALIGKVFEYLTVESFARLNKHNNAVWNCRCKCGKATIATTNDLNMGKMKSCGCFKALLASQRIIHGDARLIGGISKEYRTWSNMRIRCYYTGSISYQNYGGRGIAVCSRWKDSFEAFLEDMGRAPSSKHMIERKNNNGNYEPENCVWATRKEQANNTRTNRILTFRGESKTLAQWSDEFNLCGSSITRRLRDGWSVEEALTIPMGEYYGQPSNRASTSMREMAQLPLFAGEPSGAANVNSQNRNRPR